MVFFKKKNHLFIHLLIYFYLLYLHQNLYPFFLLNRNTSVFNLFVFFLLFFTSLLPPSVFPQALSKSLPVDQLVDAVAHDCDNGDLYDLHRNTYVKFVGLVRSSWEDHDTERAWRIGDYLSLHDQSYAQTCAELQLRATVRNQECTQREYSAVRASMRAENRRREAEKV